MKYYYYEEDKFTDIADAIRTKTGEENLIKVEEMPEKILAIESGSDYALALGGIGEAFDFESDVTDIETISVGTDPENICQTISNRIGCNFAPIEPIGEFSGYLLFQEDDDLQNLTGYFIGTYEEGSVVTTTIRPIFKGGFLTDIHFSVSGFIDWVKTSKGWLFGWRSTLSSEISMSNGWSKGVDLDDGSPLGIYAFGSGQNSRLYTRKYLEQTINSQQLLSTSKGMIAPLIADKSRAIAEGMVLVKGMAPGNAGVSYTFSGQKTYISASTHYTGYTRLALIGD